MGSSLAFVDGTVVNIALPAIQRELHASVYQAQWVVESYALLLAALLLVGGALGDRLGRRRVFLLGVAHLRRRVDCLRLVAHRATADRRSRCAGRGRGPVGAGQPGADQHLLSRGRARARLRHLGGVQRHHLRDRTSAGRLPDRPAVLGLGLRRQRAAGRDGVRDHVGSRAGEPSREIAGPLDVGGAVLATVGLGGLVFFFTEAPARGWGAPAVLSALAIGVVALVALLPCRAQSRRTDAAAGAAAQPQLRRREPADAAALRGARRRAVLPAAEPDPGAGPVRDGGRCRAAAIHPDHVRAVPMGRRAGGPARGASPADHRAAHRCRRLRVAGAAGPRRPATGAAFSRGRCAGPGHGHCGRAA